jgi:two-component system cell cycle sensor histidine kinase/response regulator CckA
MKSLRVLLVEDREDDALLVLDELRRGGFTVTHERVETAEAMRAALAEHTWDVIVSDYSMPVFTGIRALEVLHESGLDIPLIVASGTIGEETAVAALKAGAADFFSKDRLVRLVPAVERELREAEGRRRRRHAEDALEAVRSRMQLTLQALTIGISEIDLRTDTVVLSTEFERLHGIAAVASPTTLDGYLATIHADDRGAVADSIEEAARRGLDSVLEYRVKWPDQSVHWIRVIGRTLCSDTGVPLRAVGIGVDVTAQRHLEDQFRQAQKLEAIGSLAAGVAHDFNNLLTVIAGYCEMLEAQCEDQPAVLEDVAEIKKAGESASALTRQLLAFSRRQIVAPQTLDVNGVVRASHKMLRRLVEENVRIDLALAEALPVITADTGQIEQILLNLVINARDAMPTGGVVTIETDHRVVDEPYARTHLDVTPGPYVVLSISDTGTGMTPEVQARLFEPFFTTKERGRGTGLGLATVYGIVKQNLGHIWVYSEVGLGTTFNVYLPVRTDHAPASAAPLTRAGGALDGTETVLVVEDETSLRALTERMLQGHGYRVLSAANGADALRVVDEHGGPIEVVLMDVVMPGRSGRDIGEEITARRPATRIVYVSGYTDNAISHHGVLEPGVTFLQKPFTSEVLLRTIRDVLA